MGESASAGPVHCIEAGVVEDLRAGVWERKERGESPSLEEWISTVGTGLESGIERLGFELIRGWLIE